MIEAGTILQDRYLVSKHIGAGGMGAVYVGTDQRFGSTVAIKETFFTDESLRRAFEREARLLNSLRHPALARVSDHFVDGNGQFLVMEYIPGDDLSELMAKRGTAFSIPEVMTWADQLLDALIYLHSQDRQVIHRDIKPHNLKLTSAGQIALLDFGLARAQPVDPSVTSSAAFFGYTRQYAPLEQIQDLSTGPQSDIYALGATMYYLLTGHKPVDALTRAAALAAGEKDPLKPANEIHPSVGAEITLILNRAMAQDAQDRYATAREFREALRRTGRTISVDLNEENNSSPPPFDGAKTEPTIFGSYDSSQA